MPKKGLFLALLLLPLFAKGGSAPEAYQPREGDILFQSIPHNPLTDLIETATESPFSHCGIVHRAKDSWVVIEAVQPVKETPLPGWIAQGREQAFTAFRLKPAYKPKIPAFIQAAQAYEGLPYDMRYEMSDDAIYCSELIYKAFQKATGEELGKLQALRELKIQGQEDLIRQIEGGELPLDRKMITPRAISEANQLEKVYVSK